MTATGNNYAEALFMLAREENLIDEFYNGLKIAEQVFLETPEYLQFLATPSIPKSERTAALAQAFEGKVNTHILSFLCLMCEQGKSEQFFESAHEFYRLREWAGGTVVAVVKSVVELTDAQKAKIEQTAQAILNARALYPDCSLADLYDEIAMPSELRKAHQANDRAVMQAYGFDVKTMTESTCVAELMKMYQKLTK